jgi:hypothetical protein
MVCAGTVIFWPGGRPTTVASLVPRPSVSVGWDAFRVTVAAPLLPSVSGRTESQLTIVKQYHDLTLCLSAGQRGGDRGWTSARAETANELRLACRDGHAAEGRQTGDPRRAGLEAGDRVGVLGCAEGHCEPARRALSDLESGREKAGERGSLRGDGDGALDDARIQGGGDEGVQAPPR